MFSKDRIDFWFNEVKKVLSGIIGQTANGVDLWKDIWLEKKGYLLPYFDENGRLEEDVQYDMEQKNELRNLVDSTYNNSIPLMDNSIAKLNLTVPTDFILDTVRHFVNFLSPEEVINNRLSSDKGKFKAGTKASKYIAGTVRDNLSRNGISKDVYEKYTEAVNVAFSVLLNALKMKGKIGLSINPMDYILVSSHTNGWKSCHNILDGCYRMGGISYMLDNTSLVGYAYESSLPLRRSNFNSDVEMPLKLWRAMVFVYPENPDRGIISRQYPSEKIIYSRNIRALLSTLLANLKGVEPNYVAASYGNFIIGSPEVPDNFCSSRVENAGNFNYQDSITSHIILSPFAKDVRSFVITIGSEYIPCTLCGEIRDSDEEEEAGSYITCDSCEGRGIYCCVCGDRVFYDDYYYAGDYYCEGHFYDNFENCSHCGTIVPREEVHSAVDSYGDDVYVCDRCLNAYYTCCDYCGDYVRHYIQITDNEEYWCDNCVERYAYICHECGEAFTEAVYVGDHNYCKDCADELFETCDICSEYASELTEVNLKKYCEDCLEKYCTQCSCGEYTTNPVEGLCPNCAKEKELSAQEESAGSRELVVV